MCCLRMHEMMSFSKVRNEFKELRGVSTDNLLYIKEDLIIPSVSDVRLLC
jgi:hypothetical protein